MTYSSTEEMVPSASLAFTLTWVVEPTVALLLLRGDAIVTEGAIFVLQLVITTLTTLLKVVLPFAAVAVT